MAKGLSVSPLFTGLTRPPMMLGITIDYLSLIVLFSLCLFILADNPLYLVLYFPLHIFGWIACKIDPNIFRVWIKCLECTRVPNHRYWRCQSYEPF